jgi:hypothetical protein
MIKNKMKILFYGLSATEGMSGQAGWTYSLPFWYYSNRNVSVYLICSLGNIYKIEDKKLITKTNKDIENISKFDILFSRSNYTYHKNIKNFFSKFNFKIMYQCGFSLNSSHFKDYDLIIKDEDIFKPIPNANLFYPVDSEKRYISIIGSILSRKGLVELSNVLDYNTIKDYTLLICGKNKEPNILRETKKILDSKNIKYLVPTNVYINHIDLASYINGSLCILHPSNLDYNPRALIESLLCDVPFIITPKTQINKEYSKYGITTNLESFNLAIDEIKNNPNLAKGFRNNFVDKHTHEYFFNLLEQEYENFQNRKRI